MRSHRPAPSRGADRPAPGLSALSSATVLVACLAGCGGPAPASTAAPAASAAFAQAAPRVPEADARAGRSPGADCPWRDARGLLRLGTFELGTPFERLPPSLPREPNCIVQPEGGFVDCEVRDAQGIGYLADAQGVVRIEATAARAPDAGLPLGLRWGDDRATVAGKLGALPDGELRGDLRRQLARDGAVATGFCIVHGAHDPASWTLGFDASGRLASLSLRLNAG